LFALGIGQCFVAFSATRVSITTCESVEQNPRRGILAPERGMKKVTTGDLVAHEFIDPGSLTKVEPYTSLLGSAANCLAANSHLLRLCSLGKSSVLSGDGRQN